MAKTKFSFSQKMEIKLPKVEGKIDTKKMKLAVNKAIVRGTQKGATYVEASLKEALNASLASQWNWRTGTRDIIDTGRLRDSLQIKPIFSQTKVGFQISYNTPYAAFVHYGGVMKPYGNKNAADVLIPARPWIQAIFDGSYGQPKFDIKPPFDKGISEAWKAQFGS